MPSNAFLRSAMPTIADIQLVIYDSLKIKDTFWVLHKLWWDPGYFWHTSNPSYWVEIRNIDLNVWRHIDFALYLQVDDASAIPASDDVLIFKGGGVEKSYAHKQDQILLAHR